MSLLRARRFGKKIIKVNLGGQQPLTQDAVFGADVEHKRGFHYGWFASIALAGLAGAALIIGSLYAANYIDASIITAERFAPKENMNLASGQIDNSAAGARKSNRLPVVPLLAQVHSEKETILLASAVMEDGRHLLKNTPFTRIDTPLARSRTPLTADLKPFNPISIMTAAADIQQNLNTTQDNTETSPLNDRGTDIVIALMPFDEDESFADKDNYSLTQTRAFDDVLATLAPDKGNLNPFENAYGSAEYTLSSILQADKGEQTLEDVQIAYFEKTPFSDLLDNISRTEDFAVNPDDALSLILDEAGIDKNDITNIIQAITLRFDLDDLTAGHKLRIGFGSTNENAQRERPLRVRIADENRTLVAVALTRNGKYVPLDVSENFLANNDDPNSINLYYSIYETALRAKVPKPIVDQIIRIFSFDMDYTDRVQPDDRLKLIFDRGEDDLDNAKLLYAALVIGGEEKALYRFQTQDDGYIDFYDLNGQSAQKFLLRKPMHAGEFRSGFGMRRHPIHKTYRMHNGVDWRAPTGTPIVAAGDGTIIKASWAGGYGRQVKIQHKYGYVSSYSHMSRYGNGIAEGRTVRQGQIIGYVGTSGLSTGPHLHYELLVNNSRVDPMRIRLPRGRDLKGEIKTAFENQKQLIDRVLSFENERQLAELN